jgi:predicted phosphodiesterase
MKLAYCSDLHTEFGMLELENKENADVLIIAGDAMVVNDAVSVPKYEWFLENCSNEFKDVIYIMGNHEHYNGDIKTTIPLIKTVTDKFPNIHVLNNEHISIGDVTFFGSTMWTSMNDRDPYVLEYINSRMSDFRVIRNGERFFSPLDSTREHEFFRNCFELFLEAHEKFDKEGEIVVVTHHAPSRRSIHPIYANQTEVNYAYHTDLEPLILKNPKIKLWFHGHTHNQFDYKVGETRILCNPRGYFQHEREAWHFELSYVEV